MSKQDKAIPLLLLACALICAQAASAQYVEATITIDAEKTTAAVHGKWASVVGARRNLSFLRTAIGAADLGSRISGVLLSGGDGQTVEHRKFDSAEYVGDSAFTSFSYKVDLRPAANHRAAAHASWLNERHGLIYLEDILPLSGPGSKAAVVSVQIPNGWRGYGHPAIGGREPVNVDNVERSVWVIGENLSTQIITQSRNGPTVVSSGQWHISQNEISAMAAEVFAAYEGALGLRPGGRVLVTVLPFPQGNVEKGSWEAETRGSSVVLISSDSNFKSQSLQRLHEQLRHEIFHLWLPNGVALTGRYDWFYEGFAVYQSLRLGVALNQIRFEDMLETLARAHNVERTQYPRLSLIDASKARWAGAETSVYARGMLVAFICDLLLMQRSGSKSGSELLLKQLFAAHSDGSGAEDGNTAVLRLLGSDPRLSMIASDYISGDKPIDLIPFIEPAGLEMDPGTSPGRLRIKSKLNGRQRALLDKLGYNNWRKLTRK